MSRRQQQQQQRAFVVGLGAASAAGCGVEALRLALLAARPALRPLELFPPGTAEPLPVGQVPDLPPLRPDEAELPRTHVLALLAATEALAGSEPPEAIVIGVTTGGMPASEELLCRQERDPARYRFHAAGSVAEELARRLGCRGPALTVSTACSSAAVALTLALALLRSGQARTVLAGGVDGLCRMTYHGFRLLQLTDPAGARPLDRNRRGMSVAEGAGLLLLQAAAEPPVGARAELCGGGLSCDAYHPTRPLPGGEGARAALARALADAGVEPGRIGYLNLHGTGTPDNDAAEARAVRALFADPPPLSSTKGLTGHPLAAAGGLEAVISVLALEQGLLPANVGLAEVDPELGLAPLREPSKQQPELVLSSSFGFGGNNAALVLGRPELPAAAAARVEPGEHPRTLYVQRSTCLSGAGGLEATLAALSRGEPCAGIPPAEAVQQGLPAALTRRLKRLPRLVLGLAEALAEPGSASVEGKSVFFGTAWGPLSETHDFLDKLFASGDQFSSPTDFVGSVHNAPAAQVAMRAAARGANVTTTSSATPFEQAVLAASLLAGPDDEPLLLLAADEAHPKLTPLFDPAAAATGALAEGGGALLCRITAGCGGIPLYPAYFGYCAGEDPAPLLAALGGPERLRRRHAALLVGWPAAAEEDGRQQLAAFLAASGFAGPVICYPRLLGAYGTVAAAAAALAVRWLEQGALPAALSGGKAPLALDGKGLLLLTLGEQQAALELGVRPEAAGGRADPVAEEPR